MCVCVCVWSGSMAHSRPDPMASIWVVGIPPPVFAGKTQGEYLAVCLSPPSPALVDRRTHTSRSFVKWFPYTDTHMYADAHTHTQRSLHSPPLISSWLSASCYSAGDDTHACAHIHTGTHKDVHCSTKSHSCFLPNHCSHKMLTQMGWKLNKRAMLEQGRGSFLQEWPGRWTS